LTYEDYEYLLEEVKKYYSEFEGEDLWEEELATDELFYVKFYKPMPVTFGFEIEQYDADICRELERLYTWHYDGSGPYETAIGPATYPGRLVSNFIYNVRYYRCEWNWKHNLPFTNKGCGSHIHFRPRDDVEYIRVQWVEAWTVAYNTMVEVVPFMLPLFAWGDERHIYYRKSAAVRPNRRSGWAKFTKRRLSPSSVRNFLDPSYIGHPYNAIAWNRKTRAKPLTLEVRLNETHIAISYYASIILNRIIRKCYERGFRSPKLHETVRSTILSDIEDAYISTCIYRDDLYDRLKDIGPIRFSKSIPLLKNEYNKYSEVFDDIIKKYTPSYPPMARIGRLFLHRGYPAANTNALWHIFEPYGRFKWDRGPEVK